MFIPKVATIQDFPEKYQSHNLSFIAFHECLPLPFREDGMQVLKKTAETGFKSIMQFFFELETVQLPAEL